jgi:hypothetical protein
MSDTYTYIFQEGEFLGEKELVICDHTFVRHSLGDGMYAAEVAGILQEIKTFFIGDYVVVDVDEPGLKARWLYNLSADDYEDYRPGHEPVWTNPYK